MGAYNYLVYTQRDSVISLVNWIVYSMLITALCYEIFLENAFHNNLINYQTRSQTLIIKLVLKHLNQSLIVYS